MLYDELATREATGANLAADALDLALLTDNYGRAGAGVGPLLSSANSLGARDMGLLPDMAPGYLPVSGEPGLDYDAMLAGGVKALYVMGADPVKRLDEAGRAALAGLEFLVVQELFLTETANLATVVLPAVSYAEKDGTFTNTERRVQVVRKAMLELPGARADWQITQDVALALSLDWNYSGVAQILAEIGRTTPIYAGVSRRGLGATGAQWPLAPTDTRGGVRGTPFLTLEMLTQGVARGAGELSPSG